MAYTKTAQHVMVQQLTLQSEIKKHDLGEGHFLTEATIDLVDNGYDVGTLYRVPEEGFYSFNWWSGNTGNGDNRVVGCRIMGVRYEEDLMDYAGLIAENLPWDVDAVRAALQDVGNKLEQNWPQ